MWYSGPVCANLYNIIVYTQPIYNISALTLVYTIPAYTLLFTTQIDTSIAYTILCNTLGNSPWKQLGLHPREMFSLQEQKTKAPINSGRKEHK